MKFFKGWSSMTQKMKNKPTKEGFKYYAMCCATSGWCYFYFPDGLHGDYARKNNKKGIAKSVVWMIWHLQNRKNKQYLVVMTTYFILTKSIIWTRWYWVVATWTACASVGWPPKEFGKKSIHGSRFNSLYYVNNKTDNYQIFEWIDNNNIVKMVSNVHTGTLCYVTIIIIDIEEN